MRRPLAVLAAALLLSSRAGAAPLLPGTDLSFEAYVAGLHVLDLDAFVGVGGDRYQMDLHFRTVGVAGLLHPGQQVSTARGGLARGLPMPDRYLSRGIWGGVPRQTLITYDQGQPALRVLEPPNRPDRTPVSPELQVGSVDLLSAFAALMDQVRRAGSCALSLRVFDGRTLRVITARSGGEEALPASDPSRFAGPALRCDFEGVTLAGRRRGAAEQETGTRGSVWFAVLAGNAALPVRLSVGTSMFGTLTAYLTGTRAVAGEPPPFPPPS